MIDATTLIIAAEPIKFLGETLGVWLQTGAFVLSAVYAGMQVRLLRKQTDKNETQQRLRATVDMVTHEKQDPVLTAARIKFAALRDKGANFTQIACAVTSDFPEENTALMAILNSYEFMATGIHENAFDEAIYRRMKRSLVIRDWDDLSGYALEMRKRTKRYRLFVEFEQLAKDWAKDSEY